MTKEEALFQFWSSFGLKAYEESSVPSGDRAPSFPYITYQVVTGSFGGAVAMSASVWDKKTTGHSATKANDAKTAEISKAIGRGGTMLRYDGGAVWLTRGEPFAQSMGDDSDDRIRRKLLNITAEYISAD